MAEGGTAETGQDLDAFLNEHPDIEAFDLLLPDLAGVLRGKRLPRNKLKSALSAGVNLPGSIFALDVTGANVDEAGLNWETGDADQLCLPVAGTLAPASWLDPPAGQALLSMYDHKGVPFFADPRHVLAAVEARYAARGWTPVVAPELEFYLTEHDEEEETHRPYGEGDDGSEVQVYDMGRLSDLNAFLDEVYASCAEQGLPVEGTISEYAPGQMEVNLSHVPDACQAADHATLLKRMIKGVAAKHGFGATFMAKPFIEQSGNGFHIHCSVLDGKGHNVFDDGGDGGTDLLRFAIGGLQRTMRESMLVFAPNANSFRRFEIGSYAPVAPTWGYNNRTVALRVPGGPPEARRVEHRVAGADANPYLLIAAILAGMLHGIEERIDPGPPLKGNAYDQSERVLPTFLPDAVDAFRASRLFQTWFGEKFCHVYSTCKEVEYARFNGYVTPRELRWYFSSV